jgi:hypothetical protein
MQFPPSEYWDLQCTWVVTSIVLGTNTMDTIDKVHHYGAYLLIAPDFGRMYRTKVHSSTNGSNRRV